MSSSEQDPCQTWVGLPNDQLDAPTINQVLGAITDNLWVIAAVTDRIIDEPGPLYDLLGMALKRSEGTVERLRNSFVSQDSLETSSVGGHDPSSIRVDDELVSYLRENPPDARICLLRSILLDRKDRVDTFVEMSAANNATHGVSETPGEWDDDPWAADDAETDQKPSPSAPPFSLSTFLTQSLVDSACLLATKEAFDSLQILCKRHGPSVWPHRLTVLECIPAHVPPSDYQELLPKLDPSRDEEHQSPAESWRMALDWTEHPSVQAALSISGYDSPQPPLSTSSANEAPRPMSSQELTSWYRQRIRTILDSSGMVDVALSMAERATSQGIPGLDELGEELSLLSRLVYDAEAAAEDGPEDDWTLEQWKSMDSLTVVRAMLALSTPETLVVDIRKFVLPYLFVLESRAERAGNPNSLISRQLLNDFVLGAPLEMVLRIFEESKPTLPSSSRLISDNEDIARLALACLYGSNSLDEWHIMSQIFECLPAWNENFDDGDSEDAVEMTITSLGTYVTPTTARPKCTPSNLFVFFRPLPLPSLSRALDILDVHLESGEILLRWDAPAPLRWFLQSNSDKNSQRARAVRMARRPGVSRALHSQDDWEWLLEDMLKLCRTSDNGIRNAFGLLPQTEIISIFLSGILSTGRKFPFPFHSQAFD
jgi:neuroblastoma-amplified sequence